MQDKYYIIMEEDLRQKRKYNIGTTEDKERAEAYCRQWNKTRMYDGWNKDYRRYVEEGSHEEEHWLDPPTEENTQICVSVFVSSHNERENKYGVNTEAEYKYPCRKEEYKESAGYVCEVLPFIEGETEAEWRARKTATIEKLTKRLNAKRKALGLETFGTPE